MMKKSNKMKIVFGVICLVIITGLIASFVVVRNLKNDEPALPWKDFATVNVGDEVTFGTFEGNPILWDVLDKDDESVFLISHYVLTHKTYDELGKGQDRTAPTNWKKSTLRKYLNGEFLDTSFTVDEQASILTVKVTNTSSEELYKTYFPEEKFAKNRKQCGPTKDKIYCMGWEEFINYYGIEINDNVERPEKGTQFSYNAVTTGTDMEENECWWLRSAGRDGQFVTNVYQDGRVSYANAYVNNYGVRPVLRVCIK